MSNNPDPNHNQPKPDVDAMRKSLAGKKGRTYWRALEELSDSPEFDRFLADEFPNRSTLMQINRRDMLRFMGASLALAGLSGCRSVFLPVDKVVPYVKAPEELVYGEPLFYATTMTRAGYGFGVLAEQHEGRPTRIEGNPDHPESLGAVDIFSQAEVLNLYDPDRLQNVMDQRDGSLLSTWDEFLAEARKQLAASKGKVRILTGAVTSPTTSALIRRLLAAHPGAVWHSYEPAGQSNAFAGAKLALGNPASTVYDLKNAKVVVTLDGDFLNPAEFPGSLRSARDFIDGRRVQGRDRTPMNRLYAFESAPGLVGAIADHRWPVRASDIRSVAEALLNPGGPLPKTVTADNLAAVAADLQANRGSSLVVAGPHMSPEVHALAIYLNNSLGNIGKTVRFITPVEENVVHGASDIKGLADALNAGEVEVLFILGGNPAYDAPSDLRFAEALQKAPFRAHFTSHANETTVFCNWAAPKANDLESWTDSRSADGTASITQPLIAPFFEGRTDAELIAALAGSPAGGYDLVRAQWKRSMGANFEETWRRSVHKGIIDGSAPKSMAVAVTGSPASLAPPPPSPRQEVVFRADPSILDGRYGNNGWLQELPKPLTKLTWDNAVIMSPATAQALGLNLAVPDEMVKLIVGDSYIVGSSYVAAGHPDDSFTVHLGYGRTAGGTVASCGMDPNTLQFEQERINEHGGGFNAYALRTTSGMDVAEASSIEKLGDLWSLASTQGHSPFDDVHITDERQVLRDFTVDDFFTNLDERLKEWEENSADIRNQNLFPDHIFDWNGPQWGMTVDMNTCIGCNACVIACQSENNIPVVGKQQVKRHREMHWLRIDRYYSMDTVNPTVTWQPMFCLHCEKAPCEPVCPVAATVHSHEGLNQMVYNRCVGTRYCSNNCPYKVRRFNFLNFSDNQPNFAEQIGEEFVGNRRIPGPLHQPKAEGVALLQMISNPDVTVRGRGVMEKCSYCVQRINAARIEAKKAGREIKDGEIITACQQACPTKTIVFGNIADPNSAVAKMKKDPRSYLVLEDLQTRPRTSHLARLRNPNPAIRPAGVAG